jgi:predicted GIY-YIG superfamily endonuclease
MSSHGLPERMLSNTRSYLGLQRALRQTKVDANTKYYTYVLLLREGKFYVGSTDNIYMRLYQHFTLSPLSAAWVRRWGPVQRVVEITKNCKKEDETLKTLHYCSMFGSENVRGAWYTRTDAVWAMSGADTYVPSIEATSMEHLSRWEIEVIQTEVDKLIAEFPPDV